MRTPIIDIQLPPQVQETWEQHIDRGMAFLDDYLETKDWVNRIDLDRLDLNDGNVCICGQLFDEEGQKMSTQDDITYSGYEYALQYVMDHGIPLEVLEQYPRWSEAEEKAVDYGFYMPSIKGRQADNDEEEHIEDLVLAYNGFDPGDPEMGSLWRVARTTTWDLFTQTWASRIEKRRAELGTL